MFPWNNKMSLDQLSVKEKPGVLVYDAGEDHAEVYFDDSGILKVEYKSKDIKETIINPHHIVVGEGNIQRDVYHFLKPDGPAKQLRLGITKHCGHGTWSSLPHSFELNTEKGFEEVFFYLLSGESKRAIQRGKGVWFDGTEVDDVWLVHDYSFSTIPMGYHPVVAEPGVQVMYIWAYLAKKKKWEKI